MLTWEYSLPPSLEQISYTVLPGHALLRRKYFLGEYIYLIPEEDDVLP